MTDSVATNVSSEHANPSQNNRSKSTTEIEAAVFRRLLSHLDENKNAQNIDLMILAGFCRNCLSKWYVAAAKDQGLEIDYEDAREMVYGMPYKQWKDKYQVEATPEQMKAFDARHK